MATVATQIAVLNEQMSTAITEIKSLRKTVEETSGSFLPRNEFSEWKKGQTYQKILIVLITSIVVGILEYGILRK